MSSPPAETGPPTHTPAPRPPTAEAHPAEKAKSRARTGKSRWRRWLRGRYVLAAGLLVAVGLVWVGGCMTMSMPGRSYRKPLPALSADQAALATELEQDVRHLADDIGERHFGRREALDRTAHWIRAELEAAEYPVKEHTFDARGQTFRNIVATLQGSRRPREVLVVGAHYDSVSRCPAANDNGSGVAALLAIARRMADEQPKRTVQFVAFPNEEEPFFKTAHMGSYQYAAHCQRRGIQVIGMISLETMGYYTDAEGSQNYPPVVGAAYPDEGNFLGFVGRFGSRTWVRTVIGTFRKHARFPSEGAAMPGAVPGVDWSDHWAFEEHGFPAMMVTDTAPFRYPHYHEPTDTPDQLSYDRFARVVDGMVATIRELSRR